MKRLVVTGSTGFLGWHLCSRIATLDGVQALPVDREAFGGSTLEDALAGLGPEDAVIHVAGVNRGSDEEVRGGNLALADRLAESIDATGCPARLVFAGSVQADMTGSLESAYGVGKHLAAARLALVAERTAQAYVEVRLPNLYGEHGRPDYNSFVATFADRIARGEDPQIKGDREIPLLHVQDAVADLLAAAVEPDPPALMRPTAVTALRISWVADRLKSFHDLYVRGEIPPLRDGIDLRLFNVLRATMWDQGTRSFALSPHADARGAFVEVLRQHGGRDNRRSRRRCPG